MADMVNHPPHYARGGKVECIDAIEAAVDGKPPQEAVLVANVVKYVWRYDLKEPVRSLKSARWYLDRLIAAVEKRCAAPSSPVANVAPERTRTEADMEREIREAIRRHECVTDPELLDFMATLDLGDGGVPKTCERCGRMFRRNESKYAAGLDGPYVMIVCEHCHNSILNGDAPCK